MRHGVYIANCLAHRVVVTDVRLDKLESLVIEQFKDRFAAKREVIDDAHRSATFSQSVHERGADE